MIVIFNQGLENELTYEFDTFNENYGAVKEQGEETMRSTLILRKLDLTYSMTEYCSEVIKEDYAIRTIDIYNDDKTNLIINFSKYNTLNNCSTNYREDESILEGSLVLR
jgi:hypothetical protein